MRALFIYFLVFSLTSCAEPIAIDDREKEIEPQLLGCQNEVAFGSIDICLPDIPNMVECYKLPEVSSVVNLSRQETNEILGIYLNSATYAKRANLIELEFDDYFKVYAVKKLENLKVGTLELDMMAKMFKENYVLENWSELKQKIEKGNSQLTFGTPNLINIYKPNPFVSTATFITKMQLGEYENILIMTINLVLVKDRLIYYAYYLDYNGEKSLQQAKAANDAFGAKLIEANKQSLTSNKKSIVLDQPQIDIDILMFKNPSVNEPVPTTGKITIRDGVFKMNLKNGLVETSVNARYEGKKDGKHHFVVLDAEGTYPIKLEPTLLYPDCDMIVYFIGTEDLFIVGKVTESIGLE